jgi:hypothetical protein
MNDDINKPSNVNPRLVIKNIPEKFVNDQFAELINKNFENKVKDIEIVKLEHKYSKNNKICFVTTDSLDGRKEFMQFFNGFELIDPKGYKQKLTVNDCLHQTKSKAAKDVIENTIDESNINITK